MPKRYVLSDGTTFAAPQDWRTWLADALREREWIPTYDLNLKYDYAGVDRLLADFYDDLSRTDAGAALAEAAISILEHGPDELIDITRRKAGFYLDASRALERTLAMITDPDHSLGRFDRFKAVLFRLFERWPHEPRLKAALIEAANAHPDDDGIHWLTGRFAPEWLATHLPPLGPETDPFGWLAGTRRPEDKVLLDAIVNAGPDYVARTIAPLFDPMHTEKGRRELEDSLSWHPAFARAIAEEKARRK